MKPSMVIKHFFALAAHSKTFAPMRFEFIAAHARLNRRYLLNILICLASLSRLRFLLFFSLAKLDLGKKV